MGDVHRAASLDAGMPERSSLRRWITLAAIVWAGESIYLLPYTLRRDYRVPLIEALQLPDEATLGAIYSLFGALSLGAYLAGGWVADRFAPRVLLPFSLGVTALGGLALATLPSTTTGLTAIFMLWSFSTILTFWAALIKATRAWGGDHAQGRGFGLLEAGRGFVTALVATIGLQLFVAYGGEALGLRAVILLYTAACVLGALLTAWLVPDETVPPEIATGSVRDRLVAVARRRDVWVLAGIIFFGYSAYYGTFYMSGFATAAYGQSAAGGASVSVSATWLRALAPLAAGLLADRFLARGVVLGCFVVLVGAFGSLALVPPEVGGIGFLYAGAGTVAACTYALRGVFFVLLAEGGLPRYLTGTAVGLVSVVGYAPDMLTPYLWGRLLDAMPGAAGYQALMGSLAVGCTFGAGLALLHGRPRA